MNNEIRDSLFAQGWYHLCYPLALSFVTEKPAEQIIQIRTSPVVFVDRGVLLHEIPHFYRTLGVKTRRVYSKKYRTLQTVVERLEKYKKKALIFIGYYGLPGHVVGLRDSEFYDSIKIGEDGENNLNVPVCFVDFIVGRNEQ